jgi:pimeloyl-ACP methyl ester carboxylesterase
MTVRDDYVREQIMQAGGTPLRVAIRPGTGTGPPLLLCNGIGMRLEAFQPFVDALDPAIEVIRFDAPGTGGSQLPNRPYRFTTLALLLREMLQNLGRQQADVLGISWGGALAQQFALLNPRRCRRLILVATSTGLSQFRPGPTVKLSCMLTGPSGSVAAPVSWSWICCLNAMDWLEVLVRIV